MKCGFETRIDTKLEGTHPLTPWLLIHAADTINRYVKGDDGRTAYQKVKGRAFRTPVTEWGECVLYCRLNSVGENKSDLDGKKVSGWVSKIRSVRRKLASVKE